MKILLLIAFCIVGTFIFIKCLKTFAYSLKVSFYEIGRVLVFLTNGVLAFAAGFISEALWFYNYKFGFLLAISVGYVVYEVLFHITRIHKIPIIYWASHILIGGANGYLISMLVKHIPFVKNQDEMTQFIITVAIMLVTIYLVLSECRFAEFEEEAYEVNDKIQNCIDYLHKPKKDKTKKEVANTVIIEPSKKKKEKKEKKTELTRG